MSPNFKFRISKLGKPFAACVSGLLLASAFPPLAAAESAWLALVPLIVLAGFCRPGEAFKWGFVCGAVFWLCTLAWLLRLGTTWGLFIGPVAGWLLLSAYLALYVGLFAALVSLLLAWFGPQVPAGAEPGSAPVQARLAMTRPRELLPLVLIPLVWVGSEYLRSVLFTGFPWHGLGVSQYANVPIIQFAEWGGVYAVSAIVMVMNTALGLTVLRIIREYGKVRGLRIHVELMVGLLAWALFLMAGLRIARIEDRQPEPRLAARIAAVQPNVPQLKKWPAEFSEEIRKRLESRSEAVIALEPDLVVWPETAVPVCIRYNAAWAGFVQALATNGSPVLVGSMDVVQPLSVSEAASGDLSRNVLYYNSSFLFGVDGQIVHGYRKRHLVPFGEYLPFDKKVKFIQRMAPVGYSCTPGKEAVVFALPVRPRGRKTEDGGQTSLDQGPGTRDQGPRQTVRFAALICFEDVFPWVARDAVRHGARLLINQTNDAWFDGSSAPVQHMSHCVFRCVENRVPAVRSANTGVTCFIDRIGRLDAQTRNLIEAGETHLVDYRNREVQVSTSLTDLTFYSRHGDLPFALPCGIMTALAAIMTIVHARRRKRLES